MLIAPVRARGILRKAIEQAQPDNVLIRVEVSNSPVYEIECTRFGGGRAGERTSIQQAILTEVQLTRPRGEPDIYLELAEWIERQVDLAEDGDMLVLGTYGMQVDPERITIHAGFLDTAK